MTSQTKKRIHVCISNWNIRYKLMKTLKHGITGTQGTLNDKSSSAGGCLPIITRTSSMAAQTIPIIVIVTTEVISAYPKSIQITIDNKLNTTTPIFVIYEERLLGRLLKLMLTNCLRNCGNVTLTSSTIASSLYRRTNTQTETIVYANLKKKFPLEFGVKIKKFLNYSVPMDIISIS